MEPWAKEQFERHSAEHLRKRLLPWPEKLRISVRMRKALPELRKMREEWQKRNAAGRGEPPKQEPR